MRAAILVFALAALLVVAHAQSTSPSVSSNGQITLTPLNNPETKSTSAINTCYNATGTGIYLNTHANPGACESYQPCYSDNARILAGTDADEDDTVPSYSCFECDSFCDCDSDSFCLGAVTEGSYSYSERSQCVSFKSLVGQACTSSAVAALTGDGGFGASGITEGETIQYAATTSLLNANPITDESAILYRQVQVALEKGCGVYTTATNNSISYLTVFGTLSCVDAKCSACDPFAFNNCGACNSACNGPTDRLHNAYCKTNGEIGTTDRTNGAKTSGEGAS